MGAVLQLKERGSAHALSIGTGGVVSLAAEELWLSFFQERFEAFLPVVGGKDSGLGGPFCFREFVEGGVEGRDDEAARGGVCKRCPAHDCGRVFNAPSLRLSWGRP